MLSQTSKTKKRTLVSMATRTSMSSTMKMRASNRSLPEEVERRIRQSNNKLETNSSRQERKESVNALPEK